MASAIDWTKEKLKPGAHFRLTTLLYRNDPPESPDFLIPIPKGTLGWITDLAEDYVVTKFIHPATAELVIVNIYHPSSKKVGDNYRTNHLEVFAYFPSLSSMKTSNPEHDGGFT